MALVQTVHLSMANFKSAPVVPAVQNDSDRQVKMIIDDYTLTSGLTGKIAFERSDGTHYEASATLDVATNSFTADIDQALTQPGRTMVQLKVTDTLTVSTFSFVIFVEADNSGTVTPQEGIDLVTAVESAESAADRAEEAASSFELDATLTSPTKAAQAKAAGDKVTDIKNAIDNARIFSYGMPGGILWSVGSLGSTGTYATRKNTVRTNNAIAAIAGSVITCNQGYLIQIYRYNSDTSNTSAMQTAFIDRSDWVTTYTIPNNCYIRILIGDTTNYNNSSYVLSDDSYKNHVLWNKYILKTIRIDVDNLQSDVDAIQNELPNEKTILNSNDLSDGYYVDGSESSVGINWNNCLVQNATSIYTAQLIDTSNYVGDTLVISIPSNAAHSGNRGSGFCSVDGTITEIIAEKNIVFNADGDSLVGEIKISNVKMFLSFSSKNISIGIRTDGGLYKKISSGSTVYVSETGNDDNDGTQMMPMATVNAALKNGARCVCMMPGAYEQQIDLSLAKYGDVEIKAVTPNQKVTFKAPGSVITASESLVSGYTKVRQASVSVSFSANNIWIFQDGIPDESTRIADTDRMPQNRGYEHRCGDTLIAKCTSETLNEALDEIESDSGYKWYLDGTTLYFSRPYTVSADNPICGSFNQQLFVNATRKNTVKMTGIDIKYMSCNMNLTCNSVVADCRCVNVYGNGCFTWNLALNATFVRCEAARAYTGTNGDGFNAHGDNTGDIYAKETSCTLIDCWSHDNRDDGYSDHERCEMTIIGGLYEFNGKGGVTPSFGSHCTAHNVVSRYNYNGFNCFGEATEEEGGKGTQLICYNCIAIGNTRGTNEPNAGFRAQSNGSLMVCIGCKSIDNIYGYRASSGAAMTLYDCGASGNGTIKEGDISIYNTASVI